MSQDVNKVFSACVKVIFYYIFGNVIQFLSFFFLSIRDIFQTIRLTVET